MPKTFKDKDFDEELRGAGDKLVVVDFYADWCGPCRMIAPKIEAMEKDLDGAVLFYKVNVDEDEELSSRMQISAMPTFLFFKNSVKVGEVVGASEAKIREKITELK